MICAALARVVTASRLLLLCAALMLSIGATAASAQPQPNLRGLHHLWSEYPVRPPRPATSTLPSRVSVRKADRPRASRDTVAPASSFSPFVLALIALVSAMGLVAALQVLRSRLTSDLRLEGIAMNDRVRQLFSSTESDPPPEAGWVSPSGEVSKSEVTRREDETDPQDHPIAEIDELMPAEEIGEQVAAILASAKQAAHQLRESARREAEQIRNETREEASGLLEDANAELENIRDESNRLRDEARAYGKGAREAADRDAVETRRKAEEEAGRLVAQARHEAHAIERGAKKRSQELASEAIHRREALVREAERSETRLQQVLDVFHAMTRQLEELLENGRAEAPAGDLDEALKPRVGDPAR